MMTTATPIPWPPTLLHLAVLAGSGAEGSTRRRVLELVQRAPGLHQREVARQLDLRASHAEHHLRHLVKSGLVWTLEEGGYVRYFPRVTAPLPSESPGAAAVGSRDARLLALLRQARPLKIVGVLVGVDEMTLQELSETTGIHPATLTYHVHKLESAGLVARRKDGRHWHVRLVDRDLVVGLLLAHAPTPDLVEGFASLWEDVGL